MLNIEEYIMNNIVIQYAIIFLMALLLAESHNRLLGNNQKNPFKRSEIEVKNYLKMSMVLSSIIISLMILVAQSFEQFFLDGFIALSVGLISSFFIIFTLKELLSTMRQRKLSVDLLVNQYFLLTAYLVIFTNLSFLNWIKEIKTYVQTPFLSFVILYSFAIIVVGVILGFPKTEKEDKKGVTLDKRWKAIIFLDPMIVVFLNVVFLKVLLDIFVHLIK